MRRLSQILLLVCAQTIVCAQSYIQHPDTFRLHDVPESVSQGDVILQILAAQQELLKQRDDSVHQLRLATDTTTLNPFHVGYADSLRIDSLKRRYPYFPLAIPMLYVNRQQTSEQMAQPDDIAHFSVAKLYQGYRRYVNAHLADTYKGTYDPEIFAKKKGPDLVFDATPIKIERALIPDSEEDRKELKRQIRERMSPWTRHATVMLQVTQNYVSDNWYQGGNSNFAILGIVQGHLGYKKGKVTWDNQLEWRAGGNTVKGDTLHEVNMNEDLFRLYTKFGYQVYDKLYYSADAEFQTQLFYTYNTNSTTIKTGTLTPVRFNVSTGLDYKPFKGLSVVFSPITYKLVYAADTVNSTPSNYGIPAGSNVLNDVGSSVRVEWDYKPLREINLNTKFYFYTNYRKVEVDLEVTCNFIINQYFSARLVLHPRYDNTIVLLDGQSTKLQFKELISVGFSHRFH